MRVYELITIIKPQLSDNEIAEFIDKTKQLISHEGGEVVSEEKLGRRKLTHPINHVRDAFYSYMKFKSEPKLAEKLSQQLRLNDSVMRCSIMQSTVKEVLKPAPVKQA